MKRTKRNPVSNATTTPVPTESTPIEAQGSTKLRYEDLPASIRADIENTVKMRVAAGLTDDLETRKAVALAYYRSKNAS